MDNPFAAHLDAFRAKVARENATIVDVKLTGRELKDICAAVSTYLMVESGRLGEDTPRIRELHDKIRFIINTQV
jgi:predicted transcriptional regulator